MRIGWAPRLISHNPRKIACVVESISVIFSWIHFHCRGAKEIQRISATGNQFNGVPVSIRDLDMVKVLTSAFTPSISLQCPSFTIGSISAIGKMLISHSCTSAGLKGYDTCSLVISTSSASLWTSDPSWEHCKCGIFSTRMAGLWSFFWQFAELIVLIILVFLVSQDFNNSISCIPDLARLDVSVDWSWKKNIVRHPSSKFKIRVNWLQSSEIGRIRWESFGMWYQWSMIFDASSNLPSGPKAVCITVSIEVLSWHRFFIDFRFSAFLKTLLPHNPSASVAIHFDDSEVVDSVMTMVLGRHTKFILEKHR